MTQTLQYEVEALGDRSEHANAAEAWRVAGGFARAGVSATVLGGGAELATVEPGVGDALPHVQPTAVVIGDTDDVERWVREGAEAADIVEARVAAACAPCGGAAVVGDVGDDILEALTAFDKGLDQVIGNKAVQDVLTATPYGELINAAHDARYGAIHGEPTVRQKTEAAAKAKATKDAQSAQARQAKQRALTSAIAEAQRVTRAARRGEPAAQASIRALKIAAAAGNPGARRLWKIYGVVADADSQALEREAAK